MSIILKGINLPKDSDVYILAICEKGDIYIKDGLNQYVPLRGARAIQIPKGHGDIKDVGNIIKKFDENIALAEAKPMTMYADAFLNDALEWSAEYITIKDDIDNAPTILDAET